MRCEYCGSRKTHVVDSRKLDDYVRRNRACKDCKMGWTTYEISEEQMAEYRRLMKSASDPLSVFRKMISSEVRKAVKK